MTRTEDQHWTSWRRRRKRAGLRRVEIWIPTALRKALRDAVAGLRAAVVPKGSTLLVAVVPKDLAAELRSLLEGRLASWAPSSRLPAQPGAGLTQTRAADGAAGPTPT